MIDVYSGTEVHIEYMLHLFFLNVQLIALKLIDDIVTDMFKEIGLPVQIVNQSRFKSSH